MGHHDATALARLNLAAPLTTSSQRLQHRAGEAGLEEPRTPAGHEASADATAVSWTCPDIPLRVCGAPRLQRTYSNLLCQCREDGMQRIAFEAAAFRRQKRLSIEADRSFGGLVPPTLVLIQTGSADEPSGLGKCQWIVIDWRIVGLA
jgi:hypothetical protein